MSPRTLWRMTLVASLLMGLWLYSQYKRIPRGDKPFEKAVPSAQQVRLSQGALTIVLQKRGSAWQAGSAEAGPFFPVEDERWRSLESALKNTRLEDVISERADRARDFEVDAASGTRVVLRDAKGAVLVDGVFGKQSPDFTRLYFRFSERPQVYLAHGLYRGELGGVDVSGWRSHALVTLPEGAIRSVRLQWKGTTAELLKSSETWTVNGKPANAERVNTFLGALARLRADTFAEPDAFPKPDSLQTAVMEAKSDAAGVTVRIGPLDKKLNRYPVSSSDAAGVAFVAENRVAALLLAPSDFR